MNRKWIALYQYATHYTRNGKIKQQNNGYAKREKVTLHATQDTRKSIITNPEQFKSFIKLLVSEN